MAAVQTLARTDAIEGADWIVVEREETGRFQASGLSTTEDAVFGPLSYDNQAQALGAAQTWAFHTGVPVIYVRASA